MRAWGKQSAAAVFVRSHCCSSACSEGSGWCCHKQGSKTWAAPLLYSSDTAHSVGSAYHKTGPQDHWDQMLVRSLLSWLKQCHSFVLTGFQQRKHPALHAAPRCHRCDVLWHAGDMRPSPFHCQHQTPPPAQAVKVIRHCTRSIYNCNL